MSGKAINEAEAKRLESALGGSMWATPQDVVNGMARFKSALKDIVKQREARIKGVPSVGKEVIRQYHEGGGTTSDDIKSPDYGDVYTSSHGAVKPSPRPTSGAHKEELDSIDKQLLEIETKLKKGAK